MTAINDLEVIETEWIIMPDGARLAARIWLPPNASTSPVPAVLEYIPYRRRDRTRLRDEAAHPHLAAAGYACLRVDMRGSGDSDGLMPDEYTAQEIQDGADIIAWIADQPWCDGNVGMFGKSWGAFTCFQVAALKPPALKAIAPVMGTDDRFREDIHFYGGVLGNDNFWWGSIMQLYNAFPPDPESVGERWRDMWKARLDAMTFWPAQWLEHQTKDETWRRGSIAENYDAVQIPVFYFGGWADLYRDTPFRIAENLSGPVNVMMGPWAHLYPHDASPEPKADFLGETIRFWDQWLKGRDTGLTDEAPLRFWMLDSTPPSGTHAHRPGRWVEEPSWPSPNVSPTRFWLNQEGLGEVPSPGPALSICSPQTFGSAGGDMCSFAIPGDSPSDCRADAGGALCFRSSVLTSSLDILGQPVISLKITADKPQAFAAVLLVDEAPNGAQTLISRGFCNLMHRVSDTDPLPVSPGETVSMDARLHGIGYRVAAGHRIMVQVASTYWPNLWPAPEPVTLTMAAGESVLTLPVRDPNAPDAANPPAPPPEHVAPRPVTGLSAGSMVRAIEADVTTGLQTQRLYIDGGVFGPNGRIRLDDTGTELQDISDRRYTIHPEDPLSAKATMTQESAFARDTWQAKIKTHSEMTATKEHFVLTARVECFDGDALFHAVDWHHKIPRNGM
ncbi:MAG: CocE/NonD family hydrolase [Pseudomonadota bacterium]